jgi:hypothetical protein
MIENNPVLSVFGASIFEARHYGLSQSSPAVAFQMLLSWHSPRRAT